MRACVNVLKHGDARTLASHECCHFAPRVREYGDITELQILRILPVRHVDSRGRIAVFALNLEPAGAVPRARVARHRQRTTGEKRRPGPSLSIAPSRPSAIGNRFAALMTGVSPG